jgi:hypothetical protein
MDIVTGLSALNTGTQLLRAARDAAKLGTLKPDEFAGRVSEIYDYIVDSKQALINAKDEIQSLKEQVRALQTQDQVGQRLRYDGRVYWKDDDNEHPFCATCWDTDKKLIHLAVRGVPQQYPDGLTKREYYCHVHKVRWYVPLLT